MTPVQVKELNDLCMEKLGYGLDTTTLSAQDSEHNGYVIKMLEQHMSDHKSVEPPDEIDKYCMDNYFGDKHVRPFVHEVVVKDWLFDLGVAGSKRQPKHSLHLRTDNTCEWCGLMMSSLEHKAFCGHVLFGPLMRAAETGKFCDLLTRLTSDAAAQNAMTSAALLTPPPVKKRMQRPDDTVKQAAANKKATRPGKQATKLVKKVVGKGSRR